MSVGFEVFDSEFLAALESTLTRIEVETAKALDDLGEEIRDRAKEYCPVDTGRLQNSIQSIPGDDSQGHYVEVGTNIYYAGFVEFGTVKMRAQPYLRPALMDALRWQPKDIHI